MSPATSTGRHFVHVPFTPRRRRPRCRDCHCRGTACDVGAAAACLRSGRDVISVDVVVRDKSGAVVRGLTASDFEVREDGRVQEVVSFSFEEITRSRSRRSLRRGSSKESKRRWLATRRARPRRTPRRRPRR